MSIFTRRRCIACGCTAFEDGECMNCGWPLTDEATRKRREKNRKKQAEQKTKNGPSVNENDSRTRNG